MTPPVLRPAAWPPIGKPAPPSMAAWAAGQHWNIYDFPASRRVRLGPGVAFVYVPTRKRAPRRNVFNKLVEHNLIRRVSYQEYREKVRNVYSGPEGAILATCSRLSLHMPLGERMFRERKFDLHGAGAFRRRQRGRPDRRTCAQIRRSFRERHLRRPGSRDAPPGAIASRARGRDSLLRT